MNITNIDDAFEQLGCKFFEVRMFDSYMNISDRRFFSEDDYLIACLLFETLNTFDKNAVGLYEIILEPVPEQLSLF